MAKIENTIHSLYNNREAQSLLNRIYKIDYKKDELIRELNNTHKSNIDKIVAKYEILSNVEFCRFYFGNHFVDNIYKLLHSLYPIYGKQVVYLLALRWKNRSNIINKIRAIIDEFLKEDDGSIFFQEVKKIDENLQIEINKDFYLKTGIKI